ncbi:MAG TPA: cysteine synthase A [Desulfomonilaceae bacterium]|nr:cysteine synthase A [Desulfomonilaceae bacterium]
MNNRNRLLSCVGETPLVRVRSLELEDGAQIWCKLEYMNPAGSIKDRMCRAIVEAMEAEKILQPGDSLVEASGGNTAVSLAMIAAAKGYHLTLVMPETVSPERKRLLAAYGAEMVLTSASNGMKGAVVRALDIAESRKRTFTINQFENPANPEVHRRTTAVEILHNLNREPDVFVAGVGTGGTITGVGEVLKSKNPSTRVIAVEPADSPVLSGGNPGSHRIPGIGAGFVPRILNTDILDDVVVVEYEEAVRTARMVAEKEGIFAGVSSGAVLFAAMQQAGRLTGDKIVVTVLCDSGERYVCS